MKRETTMKNLCEGVSASPFYVRPSGRRVLDITAPVRLFGARRLTFGPTHRLGQPLVYVYDGAGRCIGEVCRADVRVVGRFRDYDLCACDLPEGAAIVRLVIPCQEQEVLTAIGDETFDLSAFDAFWRADEKRATVMASRGIYFDKRTDSVLYGKSALFMGDSLCHSQGVGFYFDGWAGRLGHVHSMDYRNLGRSGTAFSSRSKYGRILEQVYLADRTDFDYVILEGGVNDGWFSADVGQMCDGFDGPYDSSTLAGGLEETIAAIRRRFPRAKVGYILHHAVPDAPWGRIPQIADYIDMEIQIAKKWGIPYLDLYHDEDFCYRVLRVKERIFMYDEVHVNALGYDLLYQKIEPWMEAL